MIALRKELRFGAFYQIDIRFGQRGMPNMIREKVSELIDDGMSDEEVWRKLLELRGPSVRKSHLLRSNRDERPTSVAAVRLLLFAVRLGQLVL
jgi:hypothetical protein